MMLRWMQYVSVMLAVTLLLAGMFTRDPELSMLSLPLSGFSLGMGYAARKKTTLEEHRPYSAESAYCVCGTPQTLCAPLQGVEQTESERIIGVPLRRPLWEQEHEMLSPWTEWNHGPDCTICLPVVEDNALNAVAPSVESCGCVTDNHYCKAGRAPDEADEWRRHTTRTP